jgi:deoxyribodipyrimidine photo-lyase
MDAFIADLLTSGYVHNHARMWLASYIVHHLKMDWREAADWFEAHLLDGDLASNHLSWQWVASTFSSKPYYFNKENLARFSGEKYCSSCTAHCPFDASYETLQARLFTQPASADAKRYPLHPVAMKAATMHKAVAVYVHDEMLSPNNSVLNQPFPKIFVFDPQLYVSWPLKRLQFVMDCLSEMMNVEVWVGGTYDVLMQRNVGELITQATPNLKIREMLSPFSTKWQPLDKLVDVEMSDKRLQRFSRYWDKAGPLLLNT